MGLRQRLNDKVFKGKDCYSQIWGTPATSAPTGTSHSAVSAGGLVYDKTNDDWYVCTVAGTTFVKINA